MAHRPARRLAVSMIVALATVGCSDERELSSGRPPGALVTSAPQIDGVSVSIYDSAQPFSYLTSVIALSAMGDRVASALEDIEYERNRRLWDKGFGDVMDSAAFDDDTLIALASVTAVDARSGGRFLRPDQSGAVRHYLDDILDGRLPLAEVGPGVAAPSIATASMLHQVADNLAHRQRAADALIERIESDLGYSSIGCTAKDWSSTDGAIVVERLMASLDLGCTTSQVRSAWEGVMRTLEEVDEDLDGPRREALAIVVLTSVAYADVFGEDEIARVQAAIDRSLARPSLDAYDWIYEHKLFVDQPVAPYEVVVTPAAEEVLLYAASRGSAPYVEVER